MARAHSCLARGILLYLCKAVLNRKQQYLTCCKGLITVYSEVQEDSQSVGTEVQSFSMIYKVIDKPPEFDYKPISIGNYKAIPLTWVMSQFFKTRPGAIYFPYPREDFKLLT